MKSGLNLPDLKSDSLPILPKLGALSKKETGSKPEPAASPEFESQFANADDDPTEVGSADDILAAIGGIDGWDSLPEDSAAIISASADHRALSISDLIEGGDDHGDMTPATSPQKQSAEPNAKVQNSAPAISKNETGSGGIPAISSSSKQASASVKKIDTPSANSIPVLPKIKPAPAPTPAPITSSPKNAPVQADPAPAQPPPPTQPAQAASPKREMTEEEQLAELLNSMTPEERAEYEAYSAHQEAEAIEARRAKQRELVELYGNTSSLSHKKSPPAGLIAAIFVVIALFGGVIYWIITADHSEEVQETTVQETTPPEERVFERAAPMNTYPVNINTNGATLLYINGVETPISGNYEFVTGRRNTIMAFADGMTPYFKTFGDKSQVTEAIEVDIQPASLYVKGTIKFRLTDNSLEGPGLKVTFDGRAVSGLNSPIQDVVLGRPHVLTIEKQGLAKHMHLIWPDNKETTVTIPELVLPDIAMAGTKAYVKLPPASGKPVGIRITTGTQVYNTDVVATVMPGAMIEYQISREQRQTLEVAVIPDGFGTLSLDTTLLRDSIGQSVISFNREPKSTLRVCLRRSGELICPSMDGETTVPSGPDWEFFGAEGTDTNLHAIRGGQIQELQSNRKYGFDVSKDSQGTFKLKQVSYGKIKAGGGK